MSTWSGRSGRGGRRLWRGVIVPAARWFAVVLLGVTSGLVVTSTALAEPVQSGSVDPVLGDPVPVTVAGTPRIDTPVVDHEHVWEPGQVSWPEPVVTLVEVAAEPVMATGHADGLPVTVAAVAAPGLDTAGAAPRGGPATARVEVLDRHAAAAAGINGLLLRVDAVDGAGEVDLAVDYSDFAGAYGGAWASRLRLAELPRCAVTSPQRSHCRLAKPLESANDTERGRVSARVSVGEVTPVSVPEVATGGAALVDSQGAHAAGEGGSILALMAGGASEAGDWSATDLPAAGSWEHGGSSGGFSHSYALRMPPASGPVPSVALGYSSQAHDGLTSGSNNQASWIGDGWGYLPGFIERTYTSCANDMDGGNNNVPTGDLCWDGDGASITMSLNGVNTSLVRDDSSGTWRAASDQNWRIEHVGSPASSSNATTERWVVTTPDGTRWFFAGEATSSASRWTVPVFGNHSGEPCRSSQFRDSSCRQAWRWMLDKAVDVHGNLTRYYYATETGHYGAAGDPSMRRAYHRSGHLQRIDYGLRESNPSGLPTARVEFDTADRCLNNCWNGSTPRAANWPDTPWDRTCASTPCTEQTSPSFFSSQRLVEVSTHVRAGSQFPQVDSWRLEHEFLDYGDESQVVMWLKSVRHTGHVGGTTTLPKVSFVGWPRPNRVDHNGVPGIWRWRMQSITSETGGITTINYSSPDCGAGDLPSHPHTNTRLCYPVWWTPEFHSAPVRDWFHKYVVDSVVEQDTTGAGGDVWTHYQYAASGGGTSVLWGWDDSEFTDDDHRTYSQWRGYPQVTTRIGDPAEGPQLVTRTRYHWGMHGQPLPSGGTRSVTVTDSEGNQVTDHRALAGATLETASCRGGSIDAATTYRYWRQRTASRDHDGGTLEAWMIGTQRQEDRQRLTGSTWQRTRVDTTFDNHGRAVQIYDRGDITDTSDRRCTRLEYADNTATWILHPVKRTETVAVACSATPARPDDVISEVRTYFDGSSSHGATPSRGLPTRTDVLDDWDGGPVYVTTSRSSYDSLGRRVSATDALGHTTTVAYTPSGAGPVTRTTHTNPLGHVTVTHLDPARGEVTATVDANGRRTDVRYDPLGRLTAVWLPGQTEGSDPANVLFSYDVSASRPSVATTRRITPNGSYVTTTALLDSLQRQIQTQTDTAQGGRLVTETEYNTRGLVEFESGPNWDESSTPNGTFVRVPQGADHARVWFSYDSLGRVTKEELWSKNVKLWENTTAYGGSSAGWLVRTTPPPGGTPAGVLTNARGEVIQRRDYHGAVASGGYDAMTYSYDRRGRLATVTDAAGNEWSYEYDLRGRRTASHHPDSGTSTAAYDAAGRIVTSTDSRGETVSTVTDPLGRATARWEGQPSSGTLLAEWTYDTMPGGIGLAAPARAYVDGHAVVTHVGGYDAAGRATRVQATVPRIPGLEELAGRYMVTTLYHVDGSVDTVSLPAIGGLSSGAIAYSYNDMGQLDRMIGDLFHTGHTQVYVDSTTYNAWGELGQRTLGASYEKQVYHTYAYGDGTRRLQDFRLSRDAVGATNVAHLTYDYDPAGNVLSIADAVEDAPGVPERQCFSYDNHRRLVEAWAQAGLDPCVAQPTTQALGGPAPYWSSYTFDVTGNRTSETRHDPGGASVTSTYTYPGHGNPQPHALAAVTTGGHTDTYAHDAAGNMTSRTVGGVTEAIEWDVHSRPVTVTNQDTGQTTRMVYNQDGDRIARIDGNGDAHLFVAGHQITHHAATETTTAVRTYQHQGQVIATRSSADGLQWVAGDHHGTAAWAIAEQTMVVTYRRQDPYGNPRGSQQAWPAGQEGFVRGIADPTGLVHVGARSYDPTTGRFISSDPITYFGDSQQINGYTYANGNPVTFSDPTGLLVCAPDGWNYCPGYDIRKQPTRTSPCTSLSCVLTRPGEGAQGPARPAATPASPRPDGGWVADVRACHDHICRFAWQQRAAEAKQRQQQEEERRAQAEHEQAWRDYKRDLATYRDVVARCADPAHGLAFGCKPMGDFIEGDCTMGQRGRVHRWECTSLRFVRPQQPPGPVPDWFHDPDVGVTAMFDITFCALACVAIVIDSSGIGLQVGGIGVGGWSAGPGVTSVPQSHQRFTLQGCGAVGGGGCLQHGPTTDGADANTWGGAKAVYGKGVFLGGMWTVYHHEW